jgi:hypothetical protein
VAKKKFETGLCLPIATHKKDPPYNEENKIEDNKNNNKIIFRSQDKWWILPSWCSALNSKCLAHTPSAMLPLTSAISFNLNSPFGIRDQFYPITTSRSRDRDSELAVRAQPGHDRV